MEFTHKSVLLDETIEGLNIRPDGIYVDGTLGGAGHSYHICERLGQNGRLIGIDRDGDAVSAAAERLEPFGDKAVIVRDNYGNIGRVLSELGIQRVDGILLDIGVSSHQLDTSERGFTYKEDAPLDMRMDRRMGMTAEDIVNGYSEAELCRVIRNYGEERFAKNIAAHIARAREKRRITTTGQLADIIRTAVPIKARAVGGHPAKRTFQAIRIELNGELEVLENTIDEMIGLLNDRGRLCVITFHSLEDRIVKNKFRDNVNTCICPPDFPICVCNRKPKGEVITKKPIVPSQRELEENKRAKSAKLRIFERRIIK
ncbi:MAG: 16S rRNA (cytosine(1402)-N(4))-methyltransferase RsmH [Butyrivibrio sp.]|nr:16S rRNA (cytosine(1402)-N(4))-methyltransferase RsmH [Butyrivibrio sp.]